MNTEQVRCAGRPDCCSLSRTRGRRRRARKSNRQTPETWWRRRWAWAGGRGGGRGGEEHALPRRSLSLGSHTVITRGGAGGGGGWSPAWDKLPLPTAEETHPSTAVWPHCQIWIPNIFPRVRSLSLTFKADITRSHFEQNDTGFWPPWRGKSGGGEGRGRGEGERKSLFPAKQSVQIWIDWGRGRNPLLSNLRHTLAFLMREPFRGEVGLEVGGGRTTASRRKQRSRSVCGELRRKVRFATWVQSKRVVRSAAEKPAEEFYLF